MMYPILAAAFLALAPLAAATTQAPATSQDLTNFYAQLNDEINKQVQEVQSLGKQLESNTSISTSGTMAQFRNANAMLNIKRTLYGNFYNTPSVQSPLVRQELLKIFKKELITDGDLAELQAIVNQERPKYANQNQNQNQNTNQNTQTTIYPQ